MLNVNADTMVAGIAAGVSCREMITITDVPGILLDVFNSGSKADSVTLAEVDALITDGTISGGIIPKVEACGKALLAGVFVVRMVNVKDLRSIITDINRGVPRDSHHEVIKTEFEEVKKKSDRYLFQNYGRIPPSFTHGSGCYLRGSNGREYLDLVAGIAANALGYAHPDLVAIEQTQAARMTHVSNLYYVEEQAELAEMIASIVPSGTTRSLFCNNGAETNEVP